LTVPADDELTVQLAVRLVHPVQLKLVGAPEQFAVNKTLLPVVAVTLLAASVHTGGCTLIGTGEHIATGRPDVP
jgi:hypothetical protein